MKSLYRCLTAAALLLAMATPAFASFTLANYQKEKAAGPLGTPSLMYLVGVGDGYATMNVALQVLRQQQPFYCQPSIPLNAQNYAALLDKQIAKRTGTVAAYNTEWDIAMILLDALEETFPCKS